MFPIYRDILVNICTFFSKGSCVYVFCEFFMREPPQASLPPYRGVRLHSTHHTYTFSTLL